MSKIPILAQNKEASVKILPYVQRAAILVSHTSILQHTTSWNEFAWICICLKKW